MKCEVCGKEMREPTASLHVRETGPMVTRCLGCWMASHEMEMFLLRATFDDNDEGGRTVMGDWTSGWLREILKDPTRYR